MIETLAAVLGDVRLSFRSLWRSKVLTLAVVTTLALGIGANAAMFTLVRGVLLRPLGNVLYAMPPLCVTDAEADAIAAAMVHAVETATTRAAARV